MNPDKIGKFIYELRTEKGYSQNQLANQIPISRQAISKWERGQTIPDSSTLLIISKIFDVTINELLTGERLAEKNIQQLENTTLEILDDRNQKTKRIKKILFLSTTIIILLLISFLSYYFINSYNSIQMYTVYGQGENFIVYDGIYVVSKQKSYLKIGKIKSIDDISINKIKLYYKEDNKEEKLIEDLDIDRTIIDSYGYKKISFLKSKHKKYYLEITYNETEKEIICLNLQKDFSNNNLIFKKNKIIVPKEKENPIIEQNEVPEESQEEESPEELVEKERSEQKPEEEKKETEIVPIIEEEKKEEQITVDEEEKIEIIRQKGTNNNGNYYYEIVEDGIKIRFTYFELMKQLIMYENDEVIWMYIHFPQIYNCESAENKGIDITNPEECKKLIIKSLYTYIN